MKSLIASVVAVARRSRSKLSRRTLWSAILLAMPLGLSSVPAVAQGCAMCYVTARATPKDAQLALNRAILVMVLPPIGAMTLGVGAAIRYSKKRDRENDDNAQ